MSEFFIKRPIVAIVIATFMVLIGAICIIGLPIAQYPNIVPPEIQIQTHYTGADALTIEQSVAAPIEQKMSGVDKMNYMYSINANNGDMRMMVNSMSQPSRTLTRSLLSCASRRRNPSSHRTSTILA